MVSLIKTKIKKIKMQYPYPKIKIISYFCSKCGKKLATRTEIPKFGHGLAIATAEGNCKHFVTIEVDHSTLKQKEELKKKSALFVGTSQEWKYVLIIPK